MYYQNYHKHTSLSHRYNKDSSLIPQDYFNAMKPLADKGIPQIYSTVEHGWQGNYFHIYDDLEKFNNSCAKENENFKPIKFVFGVEAYWVDNHKDKDASNNHIILLAKNDNGRKALNYAIAKSFVSQEQLDKGAAQKMFPELSDDDVYYYYKNRMDIDLLLSLPSDDIFVTTACVAFWLKYSNGCTDWSHIDEDVLKLNSHFSDFYLEVQANNTDNQKKINAHILELHKKYGIPIISATDSHEITMAQMEDREYLLESNKISYPDEDGNYMDFPSVETLQQRYKEQGILSEDEYNEAIENTNKILDFEDIVLDRSLKVPVIKSLRNKTQEERNKIFKQILIKEWNNHKDDINQDKIDEYKKEIKHDYKEIIDCGMADYFIDDYYIVDRAQKVYGGVLTPTGRGSAVSMFLNYLLNLTKVDKVNAPVTMYSERFLTATRILDSHTPPDIDCNVSSREPFIQAQKDLIGENGTFDFIAIGKLKYKSAFKMYARANKLSPTIQNEITKQIDRYETALKHKSDDETEDDYNIYDYVDEQYKPLIDGCQKYRGIVDNLKAHACASLSYNGNAITDVGVIMVKSESTKKEVWVTLQESSTMDAFGYLKNDWLIVDSIGLTYDIYKEIGMKPMTVNQLLEKIANDDATWDIYKKGYTMCINQVEQKKSTEKVMRFKPKNIYELCQFVAAIRPSFQSMYNIFEARKHFDYGIKTFDNILQDKYCTSSFIIYQEDLMKVLGFAGFPMGETYTIIKAISKKKKYVIDSAKPKFIKNFAQAILNTSETDSQETAHEMATKVWTIIENSASYGFNCSHSYCMAIDSVTLAWLKTHYPYEFYKVTLQRYTNKGDKDKVTALKQEMGKLNIPLKPVRFGDDNRAFNISPNHDYVSQTMVSLKGIQKIVPDVMYKLGQKHYDNFIDILKDIQKTKVNKTSLDILIKIDYFSDYGDINTLLYQRDIFNKYVSKKVINKTKLTNEQLKMFKIFSNKETAKQFREIDTQGLIDYLIKHNHIKPTTKLQKIAYEVKYMGYSDKIIKEIGQKNSKYANYNKFCSVVVDIDDDKYGRHFVTLYQIKTGYTHTFRCNKSWWYEHNDIEQGDVIEPIFNELPQKVLNDKGHWVNSKTETYWELSMWTKVDI